MTVDELVRCLTPVAGSLLKRLPGWGWGRVGLHGSWGSNCWFHTQEHLIYYQGLKHTREQRALGTFVTQLLPLHIEPRPRALSSAQSHGRRRLRVSPSQQPPHCDVLGPHIPRAMLNPKHFNA